MVFYQSGHWSQCGKKKDFTTLVRIKVFGGKVSQFDCKKCDLAKKIMTNMSEYSQSDIEWAIERSAFTQRYCGPDCNNPHDLDFSSAIDLKDNIMVDGKPLFLFKNPAPILKDKYLNDWFSFCVLAEGGLFPNAGGALDQSTEFLDFYELYLSIKNIRKVQNEDKT